LGRATEKWFLICEEEEYLPEFKRQPSAAGFFFWGVIAATQWRQEVEVPEVNIQSAIEEIAQTLNDLDLPASTFSTLQFESSIGLSTIHRALRRERELSEPEAETLLRLCHGLREFERVFGTPGFRPDWRDRRAIIGILRQWRDQEARSRK
jgi:hypothetical protein